MFSKSKKQRERKIQFHRQRLRGRKAPENEKKEAAKKKNKRRRRPLARAVRGFPIRGRELIERRERARASGECAENIKQSGEQGVFARNAIPAPTKALARRFAPSLARRRKENFISISSKPSLCPSLHSPLHLLASPHRSTLTCSLRSPAESGHAAESGRERRGRRPLSRHRRRRRSCVCRRRNRRSTFALVGGECRKGRGLRHGFYPFSLRAL